jgi:hypothetical protein
MNTPAIVKLLEIAKGFADLEAEVPAARLIS